MKETLHIKNFGPIKELNLDLGKVNVLIGDQGTGKSTVAKVYALIKELMCEIEKITPSHEAILGKICKSLAEKYQIESYFNPNSFIYFDNQFLKVLFEDNQWKLLANNIQKTNKINKFSVPIYVPTERSIFSLLSTDVLFELLGENVKLPKYISQFGALFHRIKRSFVGFPLAFKEVLSITYKYENETDIIILEDDREIQLIKSSSAIQSNASLLVVLSESSFSYSNHTIIIEEPEINNFPQTQKKLLSFIISKHNAKRQILQKDGFDQTILITTHSPYVLTALNNLIYAYKVGSMSEAHREAVTSLIPENLWISPSDVNVFKIEIRQSQIDAINIFDESEGMIDATAIDAVSEFLNDEFNKILKIELECK